MASLEKMAPRQYFSHAGLMQILRIHLNCRGDQAKRLYIIGLALPKCIGHGWAIWEGKGLVGTGVGIRYPAPTLARGGEGTGSGSSGLGCDRPDLAQVAIALHLRTTKLLPNPKAVARKGRVLLC